MLKKEQPETEIARIMAATELTEIARMVNYCAIIYRDLYRLLNLFL